ncbi:MAG: glycosyltransferase [Acidimicrobiales bacterium]
MSRSMAVIVFSPGEAADMGAAFGDLRIVDVGLPIAANPSVHREPNSYLSGTEYVLVRVREPWATRGESHTLAKLVVASMASSCVVVACPDQVVRFLGGEASAIPSAAGDGDLLRLIAWASVFVDVAPGPLFARETVTALQYGIPVLAPTSSRAAAHLSGGRGMVFDNARALVEALGILDEPMNRRRLGEAGRRYAAKHYAGGEAFVERVRQALDGLSPSAL